MGVGFKNDTIIFPPQALNFHEAGLSRRFSGKFCNTEFALSSLHDVTSPKYVEEMYGQIATFLSNEFVGNMFGMNRSF